MKLSAQTLTILKNFSLINPSIVIAAGDIIKTVSKTLTVLAQAKVEETFPQTFAIYDLSRFVATIQLFGDDAQLKFEQQYVKITDGNRSVKYYYCAPETVFTTDKAIAPTNPELQFTLSRETMQAIIKAANTISVTDIAVVAADGQLSLRAFDSQHRVEDSFDIVVGETDKQGQYVFAIDNFRMIPDTYNVTIQFNANKSRALGHFKGEIAQYWIVTQA